LGNQFGQTGYRGGRFLYGIDGLSKNFQQYQGQHLPLIQQELLRQVKPKELSELERAKDLEAFSTSAHKQRVLWVSMYRASS
jgi:hypothetical protein